MKDINEKIDWCEFIINVLNDFIAIGIRELYTILDYYGISKEVFLKNISHQNFTQYHLAQNIGCNVEIEQPELLNRLKLNQMNEMESLCYIGLNHYWHFIDYSRKDDYGIPIPEYEINFQNKIGVSLDNIKRDLRLLEPDIRSKEQTTIDKFLNGNSKDKKTFMLLKGYLPIQEFSIELNKQCKNDFPLEYVCDYKINDFNSYCLMLKTSFRMRV